MANERSRVTSPRSQVTVDAAVSKMTAGCESHCAPSGAMLSSVKRLSSRRTSCHCKGFLWASRLPSGQAGTGEEFWARAGSAASAENNRGRTAIRRMTAQFILLVASA
jgi:hypothetical protein